LQHFTKRLRAGGEAAIVIKNTFLSNGDASSVRKELLETCNLHTVLDLPAGAFKAGSSAGVKTVVLFFEKGKPTKKIWYYQLDPGRSLGKTNALNSNDFSDFLSLYKKKADSENSWSLNLSEVDQKTFDLSVRNPNVSEIVQVPSPNQVMASYKELNIDEVDLIKKIK
jgi:type I restriction enzyme M protein